MVGIYIRKKRLIMNISKKVIEFIKDNKIATAELSDAMGKMGLFEDSYSLFENLHKVGFVYYIAAYGDSNWSIHYALVDIPDDSIVLIENIDCEKALFGEIVAKHIFYNKNAKAIATNGFIRDFRDIKKATK